MHLATAAWIPREHRFTANMSRFFTYLLRDRVTRDGVDAPTTTRVACACAVTQQISKKRDIFAVNLC